MTVNELIKELQKHSGEKFIVLEDEYSDFLRSIFEEDGRVWLSTSKEETND